MQALMFSIRKYSIIARFDQYEKKKSYWISLQKEKVYNIAGTTKIIQYSFPIKNL